MLLLCFLFLSWIFYLFMEARQNEKALSSFRAVIHVNGIRGKTSTCRAKRPARTPRISMSPVWNTRSAVSGRPIFTNSSILSAERSGKAQRF